MIKTKKVELLSILIDQAPIEELIDAAENAIEINRRILFSCANPHSLVIAQNDNDFINALNTSNQVVSDGFGTTAILKLLGSPVPRITGHDYFHALMSRRNHGVPGYKVFFFGSSPKVLSLIEKNIKNKYPHIQLVGVYSPPYGKWSSQKNDSMIQAINDSNPDILWVGMTAPKQEKWIKNNAGNLNASVIGAIGAVFDFVAGTYPRAPKIFCKLGLEWVYRLYKEPRRMWKRNFISTPLFLIMVFKQHILRR